jgi:anti-sigma regulatory factor (Ser/Thr protein kinase)
MTPTSRPQAPFIVALALVPRSVPQARRYAARQAALWGLPSLTSDVVALIATELFTNAVEHGPGRGSGTISLVLQADTAQLRVEVTGPAGGVLPDATEMPGPDATAGRGLPIVARLAASMGWHRDGDRLAVWATVPFTNCPGERAA